MPSFLSKVFGRKKDAPSSPPELKQKRTSVPSLLEGKYEAVSPTVSPSASRFTEYQQARADREKERDNKEGGGLALFRGKSRLGDPSPPQFRGPLHAPQLSLHLPESIESRRSALDDVFDTSVGQPLLTEEAIGARMLDTHETLALVVACVKYINERGLETLGLMHPHWHSSSYPVQRKLISLYLNSLSASSSSVLGNSFESELGYTHDPHDVASVLRWALRHFRPSDAVAFGGDDSYNWYTNFAKAERDAGYPEHVYSQKLVIPAAHAELLATLLDFVSSVAAHAEANGISGSKLSKLIGLWLLGSKGSSIPEDWRTFYDVWEKAGRILEHLFLARIRDQSLTLPIRLTELVTGYPYGTYNAEDGLLPRPRVSTRRYSSILVHVDSEINDGKPPKQRPLQLVSEALSAPVPEEKDENVEAWITIRSPASTEDGPINSSRVFSDDTMVLLASITPQGSVPASVQIASPSRRSTIKRDSPTRKRASTVGDAFNGRASSSSPPTLPALPAIPNQTTPLIADWSDFQNLGFFDTPGQAHLASTLMDSDVEKTSPASPLVRRKSSRKRGTSTPPAHKGARLSLDIPSATSPGATSSTTVPTVLSSSTAVTSAPARTKSVIPIELDEAFIDFWSDAIADPVAVNWPQFVICELRAPHTFADGRNVRWIVLERTFSRPAAPAQPASLSVTPSASERAASPLPSVSSAGPSPREPSTNAGTRSGANKAANRMSATFSVPKKRFGLFSRSSSEKTKGGKGNKSPTGRIGEMGEVLPEEDETLTPPAPSNKKPTGLGIDGVAGSTEATTVTTAAVAAAAVGAVSVAAVIGEKVQPEELARQTEALAVEAAQSAPEASTKEPMSNEPTVGHETPRSEEDTSTAKEEDSGEKAPETSNFKESKKGEPSPFENPDVEAKDIKPEDIPAPASDAIARPPPEVAASTHEVKTLDGPSEPSTPPATQPSPDSSRFATHEPEIEKESEVVYDAKAGDVPSHILLTEAAANPGVVPSTGLIPDSPLDKTPDAFTAPSEPTATPAVSSGITDTRQSAFSEQLSTSESTEEAPIKAQPSNGELGATAEEPVIEGDAAGEPVVAIMTANEAPAALSETSVVHPSAIEEPLTPAPGAETSASQQSIADAHLEPTPDVSKQAETEKQPTKETATNEPDAAGHDPVSAGTSGRESPESVHAVFGAPKLEIPVARESTFKNAEESAMPEEPIFANEATPNDSTFPVTEESTVKALTPDESIAEHAMTESTGDEAVHVEADTSPNVTTEFVSEEPTHETLEQRIASEKADITAPAEEAPSFLRVDSDNADDISIAEPAVEPPPAEAPPREDSLGDEADVLENLAEKVPALHTPVQELADKVSAIVVPVAEENDITPPTEESAPSVSKDATEPVTQVKAETAVEELPKDDDAIPAEAKTTTVTHEKPTPAGE